MRLLPPLTVAAWLLLLLAAPALASVEAGPDSGEEQEAADDGGFGDLGDDMFSLEPVDPDLPNKIRKWNAECYACHSEAGVADPPRDDMDLEKLAGLVMESTRFDSGVHTGMACKECHDQGYVDYPHGEPGQRHIQPCLECHRQRGGEIQEELKRSVHYQEHGDKFTCVSCHEAHYMQVAEKIRLPRPIARQDNGFCLQCHESETRYSEIVPTKELPDLDRVHDWLPNPQLHWAAVRCVDCHSPVTPVSISHEIQPKDKASKECVSCHSRDSTLRTRLYRYLVREDRLSKEGFLNGYVLTDAYVVGATRNEWLDRASFLAVALVLGGIALHAFLRIVSALLRRRKTHV
jgi:nitrate/TMAO reductase-like tetraheme cytochrome c subunit